MWFVYGHASMMPEATTTGSLTNSRVLSQSLILEGPVLFARNNVIPHTGTKDHEIFGARLDVWIVHPVQTYEMYNRCLASLSQMRGTVI